MKPFDLEAAKRGEPFGYFFVTGGQLERRDFIGVRANGDIVYEHPSNGSMDSTRLCNLRMLPRKHVRWCIKATGCEWRNINATLHKTRELAEAEVSSAGHNLAVARVEWEE